jgi:uncharacterized phage infection (PIP) family protein YhgE
MLPLRQSKEEPIMAEQKTFRTALNGFNREDVVRYIEYLNAQHASELNRLNSELVYLRNQFEQASAAPEAPAADSELVEAQAARIRELFDLSKAQEQQIAELTARLSEAQGQADAAVTEKARLNADLDQALQHQNTYQSRVEEELEAYRRAERTERMARERAEQLYHQANAILADATTKVDNAATLLGKMSDKVMGELSELQNAVADSKQALRDAAATMYTIRPNVEQN